MSRWGKEQEAAGRGQCVRKGQGGRWAGWVQGNEGARALVGGAADAARNPFLGDVLVVVAQLAAATQFIVEEKYLAKYRVPALLAVGLEGFWGLLICAVALPALSLIKGPAGLPLDSAPQAWRVSPAPLPLLLFHIQRFLTLRKPGWRGR